MDETILKFTERQTVANLLPYQNYIIDILPSHMDHITVREAQYHADIKDDWIESNQVDTERNLFFHRQVIHEAVQGLDDESVVLELGAGVGFDAKLLIQQGYKFKCYILSEISCSLLRNAKHMNQHFRDQKIIYCCLDATQIMISENQIDVVFMIATLHHLPDLYKAISEINRVSKSNARIIFGIEPNSFWTQFIIKLRPFLRKLFAKKIHSAADEEATGFVIRDFKNIALETGWEIEKIMPVWFFTGFLHYGLEVVFRLFRLKKRIRLPHILEQLFIVVDKYFFILPNAKNFAWHYTVVFKKA